MRSLGLAAAHRGQFIDPVAEKPKIGEFALIWPDGMGHLKPSTAARYASIVRVHLEPPWGLWSLGEVRHLRRVLSMIFEAAVTDGRIATNPAAKVRRPSPVRGEPRFLTADEVTILVRHSGAEEISVAVLALTGLRFGELAALRVKRVDLGRHRLTIAESVTEVGGRPSRTTLKTQHSRSVPFPPSLLEPIGSLGGGQGADDLVFTSPEGLVGAANRSDLRKRWVPLVHKVCGLVRWVSSGRGADSRRGRFGCASWVLGRVRFGWLRDAMGLQELVASEARTGRRTGRSE